MKINSFHIVAQLEHLTERGLWRTVETQVHWRTHIKVLFISHSMSTIHCLTSLLISLHQQNLVIVETLCWVLNSKYDTFPCFIPLQSEYTQLLEVNITSQEAPSVALPHQPTILSELQCCGLSLVPHSVEENSSQKAHMTHMPLKKAGVLFTVIFGRITIQMIYRSIPERWRIHLFRTWGVRGTVLESLDVSAASSSHPSLGSAAQWLSPFFPTTYRTTIYNFNHHS